MTTNSNTDSPNKGEMYNPILRVVKKLGGSATTSEIESDIIGEMGLDDSILDATYSDGKSQFLKGVGWARHELTRAGYLENVSQTTSYGVWALTAEGSETVEVDPEEVKRRYRAAYRQVRRERQASVRTRQFASEYTDNGQGDAPPDDDSAWRDRALGILLAMEPSAFERLCQRVLRQSGFTDVNVTGHSGDGGIDGNGTVRIGGLISFPILFQCKRWKGSVGSGVVRDFRGAMQGRADRGLIITTGTFSYDATKEASRDGAPPIDLIDGDALLDKLKELRLGVRVEMVEQTTVDAGWWGSNFGVTVE